MSFQIPFAPEIPSDRPLRLVFMGTPDFAVPSLQALLEAPYEIVRVYTQPDRKKGRGQKKHFPPVKQLALDAGIPVRQPEKMTSPKAHAQLTEDAPDMAIVIAYGKILRPSILSIPPLGCINCHASLLPAYRGAAPIQRAIADGASQTGITTMLMDAGMDTGPMLQTVTLPIGPNETAGSLHDRLAQSSATLLLQTLHALCSGTLTQTPQEHTHATMAPMIHKQDLWIDFTQNAQTVHNWIRALSPTPGARCLDPQGQLWKWFNTQPLTQETDAPPGTLLEVQKDALLLACANSVLKIHEAQREGKTRMPIASLRTGFKLEPGMQFSTP
ncbi:MAG: methionyl-tRNA formyltransferase [Myxococcota bacterium]